MAPTGSAHATYAVGAVTIIGGLYAYVKKGSMASFLGAAAAGGLFLAAGRMIDTGKSFEGHALATVSSAGLAGIGAWRYAKSGKPMPGAVLIVMGLVSAVYQYQKTAEWS